MGNDMIFEYGDYSIRPLEEEDLKMVLEWRNTERVHSVMLTDHRITWEEHYAWFQRNKDNKPSRNLIFCYLGKPVGYIGYTEYDEVNRSCSPGAYLGVVEDLPIDAGLVLFVLSIDYAFKEMGMNFLQTDVLKTNKRALKIDKALGYKVIGEHKIVKNSVNEFAYIIKIDKSEWDVFKFL